MRPFTINPTDLAAKSRDVGNSNARKQCLLQLCVEHLDVLALDAGTQKLVEQVKTDPHGHLVLDDKKQPVTEMVPAVDTAGQPIYEEVAMEPETLVLYQVASTLVKLLREEWTYK